MRIPVWLAVAVCGCGAVTSSAADLADRFRAEAPIGWSALREFSLSSRGTVREITVPQAGAKQNGKRFEVVYRWNNNAGNERFETAYEEGPMAGSVSAIVANQRYGSSLARRGNDKPFYVKNFGWNPQGARDQMDEYRLQAYALKVDAESADGIVRDPSFKMLDIRSKNSGDEELIEVDFNCDVKHRPSYNVKGGQIVFSPAKKWAVVSYALKIQYPDAIGLSRGTSEYSPQAIDGIPIITRHVCSRTDATETLAYFQITLDYSEIGRGTATDEECSLPAFGLPEMQRPGAVFPTKALALCIGVGLLFLVAAVFIRRRRNQTVTG